jgi:hypothetical protein
MAQATTSPWRRASRAWATEATRTTARNRLRTAKRNALNTLLRHYERCYGEPLF